MGIVGVALISFELGFSVKTRQMENFANLLDSIFKAFIWNYVKSGILLHRYVKYIPFSISDFSWHKRKLKFMNNLMVKSGPDFFYFEINRAPSELLLPSTKKSARKAEWAGKFAATLKGLVQFQNKKLDHFSPSFFKPKMVISRSEILVHL